MSDKKKFIPEKTVERLSLYRRILKYAKKDGISSIYSHEIADRANTSAVIVRRDLMNVGHNGSSRHGYSVDELISCIHRFFNGARQVNIAIIGMGNLGIAIRNFIEAEEMQFQFVAGFDSSSAKIIDDKFFLIDELESVISDLSVDMVVIAVPHTVAQKVADRVYETGVTSLVNFAPIRLKAPDSVHVESIDITTLFEKSIYFGNIFKNDVCDNN
ncbi:MAG: redox-sensing transcriptional repressor Rex [Bacteriovoracaceae bacterium]|nr:redox-sensing transcriptional repressor Rex [Bacteriovoracaceae bacterium]